MGLSKTNRLKHRKDFKVIYQQGLCHRSPHLILRSLSVSGEIDEAKTPQTRFGISISQKVSKKAAVRNRIKRQIRAAIRALLPYLLPGWKVIVVVRPSAIECKYEHFLRELKQLLIKAEIVNGHSREHVL